MTVTVADLADYVNVRLPDPGYRQAEAVRAENVLTDILIQAGTMVDERLKETGLARIPNDLYDLAHITLGAELWNRRNSPNGTSMWGPDGQVAYLSSDPMKSVIPILRPYLPLGAVA